MKVPEKIWEALRGADWDDDKATEVDNWMVANGIMDSDACTLAWEYDRVLCYNGTGELRDEQSVATVLRLYESI
jgi:hypothetical protein